MIVGLGSIFRNSAHYLPRYFHQASCLRDLLRNDGDELRLLLVEGDSIDGTWPSINELARMHQLPLSLVKREHGGPMWGSVDKPERWAALAWCGNGVMEQVPEYLDALIYVESDLMWSAATMVRLLDQLCEAVPAIAPMSFAGEAFYDIWGHSGLDGTPFGPFPPYHHSIEGRTDLVEIATAGSCIVMNGAAAKHDKVRFEAEDCIRGLCRNIRAHVGPLWLDPTAEVRHP